jgi:hypothetical protein
MTDQPTVTLSAAVLAELTAALHLIARRGCTDRTARTSCRYRPPLANPPDRWCASCVAMSALDSYEGSLGIEIVTASPSAAAAMLQEVPGFAAPAGAEPLRVAEIYPAERKP